MYETIKLELGEHVATLTLNRPQVKNAFNQSLLSEMRQAIAEIRHHSAIRVLVISGGKDCFCAGGDMNWLRKVQHHTYEQNLEESYQLSEMFNDIYQLSIPTIAKICGPALGGGVGIVATCDIAVASETAMFSLSEAKIGLVPACVAAYLIERVGASKARYYFLTGKRFYAPEALEIGLIHEVCTAQNLDARVEQLTAELLTCGPNALSMAKQIVRTVPHMSHLEFMTKTAEMIAKMRVSEEGQEGFQSFFEKRDPSWKVNVQKNTDR